MRLTEPAYYLIIKLNDKWAITPEGFIMKTKNIKILVSVMCVAVIVATTCAMFVSCVDPYNVNMFDGIPNQLQDSDIAPDQTVAATAGVSITDTINDASLSTAEKIQAIMSATEQNEITAERFNYFQYKVGSTDLNSNHGTLIYQRLRKQNQKDKDDTTFKLAVNHNFDMIAINFVQDAMIRFVYNNKIYRIQGDPDNLVYDETSGLLTMSPDASWSKGKNFGDEEFVQSSQNLDETKKTCVNWDCDGIVLDEGATITALKNPDGATYYELKFTINLAVANADSSTIDRLQNDNGGSGMSLGKMEVRAEVWECGLMKFYETEETWSGTIVMYSGSADTHTYTWYSYTERDNDMSDTVAILNTLL